MAAYKRPPTVQVRKKSHRTRDTSQTPNQFLSPFSYDQIHKKLRKTQEHEEQFNKP